MIIIINQYNYPIILELFESIHSTEIDIAAVFLIPQFDQTNLIKIYI